MRSYVKLPGTALLAAAALFAVVASSSTANAFTFRAEALPATAQSGPESVQSVAVNWWDARRARHDIVHSLRDDCRSGDTRSQRQECYREARNSVREMQHDARDVYRDCRSGGGTRAECRQAVWNFWIGQANGGTTSAGGDTTDTGGTGGVTDDLPQ